MTPKLTPITLEGAGVRTHGPESNLQVAMPMGGLGAGCISFNGYGGWQDYAIYHKPAFSLSSRSQFAAQALFAIVRAGHPDETANTRLLEGPIPRELLYNQAYHNGGFHRSGTEGFPRFKECSFRGSFPFAQVDLRDASMPVEATVTAWSPFIPGDEEASGLPALCQEITLRNPTDAPVRYELSLHASHLAQLPHQKVDTSRSTVLPEGGFAQSNVEPALDERFGSAAMLALTGKPKVRAMWYRGGWFDALSALWRELSEGRFHENDGSGAEGSRGRNGSSLLLSGELAPGEEVTEAFVLAWHFPNVHYRWGGGHKTNHQKAREAICQEKGCCQKDCDEGKDCGGEQSECCCQDKPCCEPPLGSVEPDWRPWYAGRWEDATAVARWVKSHYSDLRQRTLAFRHALTASTMPEPLLDAVSANLAILKSPTVLRQENGTFWAWEGCSGGEGCCGGSCTHVWNYAQALPHLFPALERTFREQEWERSMDESGHTNFRSALPDNPTDHGFHGAADGQLGGIMKLYRDWHISGDTDWMKCLLPLARRSLDWCLDKWDPDRTGLPVEPHHNTYDIEFWGPDPLTGTMQVGALTAMAEMLQATGEEEAARPYRELAGKGAKALVEVLDNGEFFRQEVRYRDLKDDGWRKHIAGEDIHGEEERILLEKEGPKYQVGSGCLSDGVIGAWMATLFGLDTPLPREAVRRHLQAVVRHNLKEDLSTHANPQRPGYALGSDGGLLLCSWPNGGKPTLPFPYSDEVWPGIEYQVASHLLLEGEVTSALKVVAILRKRFDGRARNPWDEYECGSFYARSLASYALLASWGGLRYDAVGKTLQFHPVKAERPQTLFLATASGWGTVTLSENAVSFDWQEGTLQLRQIETPHGKWTGDEPVAPGLSSEYLLS